MLSKLRTVCLGKFVQAALRRSRGMVWHIAYSAMAFDASYRLLIAAMYGI